MSGTLTRILAESESLAFAGLLVDVGKRYPALFMGPLRPLLAVAALYRLDIGVSVKRQGTSVGLMAWGMRQPAELVKLAREWHGLPHRKQFLREHIQLLLTLSPDLKAFFGGVLARWRAEMAGDDSHPLRFLVEQLNPDKIVEKRLDDGRVMISVQMPDALVREAEESGRQREDENLLMMTPMQCRMRLDQNDRVKDGDLDDFWAKLQRLDGLTPPAGDIDRLNDPVNGVLGGVAVLVVLNRDWLSALPDRLEWCRQKLCGVYQTPPQRSPFDSEDALGNYHWDAFAAEAGAALLAEDPTDPLARCLVAHGVMANRYATVALTLRRASALRERLEDDFRRLVSLAIRYSTVRAALTWRGSAQMGPGEWDDRAQELYSSFMAGTLSPDIPSLAEENEAASRAIDEVRQEAARERARRTMEPGTEEAADTEPPQPPRIRVRPVSLDTKQLVAALTPLAPGPAATEAKLEFWATLLGEILTLALGAAPQATGLRQSGDDFPTDFDGWVFEQITGILTRVSPEQARSLWRPILDLGTPGHHWAEWFLWDWFVDGYRLAPTPEAFTVVWEEMIPLCCRTRPLVRRPRYIRLGGDGKGTPGL